MTKRQLLIDLFKRNMYFIIVFREDYKKYLEKTILWNETAFIDSKIPPPASAGLLTRAEKEINHESKI